MRKLSLIGHYKLDATPKMLHWSILDIGGVFGRVDFREDEKQKKKKRRELFGECLVGRGREENIGWSQVFFP